MEAHEANQYVDMLHQCTPMTQSHTKKIVFTFLHHLYYIPNPVTNDGHTDDNCCHGYALLLPFGLIALSLTRHWCPYHRFPCQNILARNRGTSSTIWAIALRTMHIINTDSIISKSIGTISCLTPLLVHHQYQTSSFHTQQ